MNNRNLDVYNGDIGVIKSINHSKNLIVAEINDRLVEFEKEEWKYIRLAFATTIHKAQGGQAKVVMTVLSEEQDIMLTRNLFYTGITRTEETFILFGSKEAVNKAIQTNRVRDRKTTLTTRLNEYRKYIQYRKCN
jgi:exodeoxyribonuclease V alpha subunit